jgi:hypothetical protein
MGEMTQHTRQTREKKRKKFFTFFLFSFLFLLHHLLGPNTSSPAHRTCEPTPATWTYPNSLDHPTVTRHVFGTNLHFLFRRAPNVSTKKERRKMSCRRMLLYADVADVCWRMLAYAGVCWRMLAYAGVCWSMLLASHCRPTFSLHHAAIFTLLSQSNPLPYSLC